MKKVLITMAVFISLMAGGMVFSSFTAPKQDAKEKSEQKETNVPTYWEGQACLATGVDRDCYRGIYIYVYQTEGMCNSFYAKTKDGDEMWVKTNPYYDPENRHSWMRRQKYYVTHGRDDYYFSM